MSYGSTFTQVKKRNTKNLFNDLCFLVNLGSCNLKLTTSQFQAANDTSLMVKRMWRYLGPSLLLAVIMNISKFFELTIIQHEDGTYGYDLTPLRRNTTYSAVTNWMRLIFMGAVPLVIIIFFNFKVYQDVRERSLRNFKRKSTKFPKSSAKVKVSYVLLSCKDSSFLVSI